MQWAILILAICTEIGATLSLKMVSDGRHRWYVGAGYIAATLFLSFALSEGLALGVAYGIWAAARVAATAVLSKFLFKEPLTLLMGGGIALIICGVLFIELGAAH